MRKITLYRYKREGGGVTVSTVKPDCEYTELYRLVADEGKALQKGEIITSCIDVNATDTEGWTEVDAPEDEIVFGKVGNHEVVDENAATEADYIGALQELGVEV